MESALAGIVIGIVVTVVGSKQIQMNSAASEVKELRAEVAELHFDLAEQRHETEEWKKRALALEDEVKVLVPKFMEFLGVAAVFLNRARKRLPPGDSEQLED